MRKKGLLLGMLLLLTLALCACGGPEKEGTSGTEDKGGSPVLSAEGLTIDGVYVDDSFVEEGTPLKMVYLFYTVTAQDKNIETSSKGVGMQINEANTYKAEQYSTAATAAPFASSYYYGGWVQDIYTGTTAKFVSTFEIPENDLTGGKTVKLSNADIPAMAEITFTTDDIQHMESGEAIAKAVDPEGYAAEMTAREDADAETTQKVKSLVNGYYWDFYVNNTAYQMEFFAPDTFELRTSFATTTGKYSVQKGYVTCVNDSNGHTTRVPYSFENGDIKLELADAYDVNEG